MHHALEVQEILLNIFGHGLKPRDLSALARTCRTFNKPALDILWGELPNLIPLAKCLPEAFHLQYDLLNEYSFSRLPTQAEWDILQRHTRRVRSLTLIGMTGFDEKSVEILSKSPEPLFPNLRRLSCDYPNTTMPLLRLPFPHLNHLDVLFEDPHSFLSSVESSFPTFSPNLTMFCIRMRQPPDPFRFIHAGPNYFCQWRNLQTLVCPDISLGAKVLVHLSSMPALTQLTFMVSSTLSHQNLPPLAFPNLRELALSSASLDPVLELLSRMQLVALKDIDVVIETCPSKQTFSSFFAILESSCSSHTLQGLRLNQKVSSDGGGDPGDTRLVFGLDALHPCKVFTNLHRFYLNIQGDVTLTDAELLTLASSWRLLDHLSINEDYGWHAPSGGITPNAVLELLQTYCPSLRLLSLAMDVHGYDSSTAFDRPSETESFNGSSLFCLDVLDSTIDAASVPALAAFLARILPTQTQFFLFRAWEGSEMTWPPNVRVHKDRWKAVYTQASGTVIGRCC